MRSDAPHAPRANRYARGERLRRLEVWVPRVGVALVVAGALAAGYLSGQFELSEPVAEEAEQAEAVVTAESGNEATAETASPGAVVTAPPLNSPTKTDAAKPEPKPGEATRSPTSVMGAAPATCGKCGVVETVVAVHGYAEASASGYQMHIRMDDGTVRTVEQRGALAPGSRVIVDRGSVRVLAKPASEG
jgi:hypothetical protein